MNTNTNTNPQDSNPKVDEVQGAVESERTPVAASDRTLESGSDFAVTANGQVTGSLSEQDSRTSPASDDLQETLQGDAAQQDSQPDTRQVDQRFGMLRPDVQSDVSQSDPRLAVSDDSLQTADGTQTGFQDGIPRFDSQPDAFRAAPAQTSDSAYAESHSDASQAVYQESNDRQPVPQEETASGDSQLRPSEQDSHSANPLYDAPQTGPQYEAVETGFKQATGSQFNTVPGAAPVGVRTKSTIPQVGPRPVASQFGRPQGGPNPIPSMTAGARPAYPSQAPYPVQTPYMVRSQYPAQPAQTAPPVQRDSGQANGMAIAAIILAVAFWPLGLIFSIISICVSSGRKNRTSRVLSLVALGLSLFFLLTTCIALFVVIHSSFNLVDKAIDDATSQTYSPADQPTDGSNGNFDDDDDWESGLEYSGYDEIEPICDLTSGLEFIA